MNKFQLKAVKPLVPITKRLYVIDTSYLLELYRVEGNYEKNAHSAITQCFSREAAAQFFVPVAVLFELANHIADAHKKNFQGSQSVAKKLRVDVQNSLEKQQPWIITHATGCSTVEDLMKALDECMSRFSEKFAAEQLGLTDATVVLEAERLRQQYKSESVRQYQIHIWTRHAALKEHEPDAEPNPFI